MTTDCIAQPTFLCPRIPALSSRPSTPPELESRRGASEAGRSRARAADTAGSVPSGSAPAGKEQREPIDLPFERSEKLTERRFQGRWLRRILVTGAPPGRGSVARCSNRKVARGSVSEELLRNA